MKRILLLPILFFFAATLFINAGGKCKFDYDKVDKFSGKKIMFTNVKLERGMYSQIGNNAGEYYFSLGLVFSGELNAIITPNDTMAMRLENGKMLKFTVKEDCTPKSQIHADAYSAGVSTTYSPNYYMSKKRMEKLSESPIVALKLHLGNQDVIIEIKESKAKKIMEAAACLISESQE